MKITVIYGDDTRKSRERFGKIIDAIRVRGWDIIHLDGSDLTLAENLSSNSLFENSKLFVVEDLHKFNKAELRWLSDHVEKNENNMLIFVDGSLPSKLKFISPKIAKFEEFSLPKTVFKLLDNIYPGNVTQSIKLLHLAAVGEPIELIFSLIGTHIRDLYWILSDPNSFSGPSWKKDRLLRQSKKFSNTSLESFITALAEIDSEVKLSQAEILPSLDLLFASELE